LTWRWVSNYRQAGQPYDKEGRKTMKKPVRALEVGEVAKKKDWPNTREAQKFQGAVTPWGSGGRPSGGKVKKVGAP